MTKENPNTEYIGKQLHIYYMQMENGNDADWAALYVNGMLEYEGHTDSVEAHALQGLGITFVYDSAFMRGGNGMYKNNKTASSLAEIEVYRKTRNEKLEEIANLEHNAKGLLSRADEMRRELGLIKN
jgi:hypothetical protein